MASNSPGVVTTGGATSTTASLGVMILDSPPPGNSTSHGRQIRRDAVTGNNPLPANAAVNLVGDSLNVAASSIPATLTGSNALHFPMPSSSEEQMRFASLSSTEFIPARWEFLLFSLFFVFSSPWRGHIYWTSLVPVFSVTCVQKDYHCTYDMPDSHSFSCL